MSNNKKEKKEEKLKDTYYVQKYSDDKILAEAILIGDAPFFLVSEGGKIGLKDKIELANKILKPLEDISYVNKPYTFISKTEVDAYLEKLTPDTLESLYRRVKSIWKKYIDADDFHLSICAADTIFTYFQDKIGLTHYLFFVGNPASGKSNNLTVFQYLAYRNMTSSDMSHSNIYQFLGSADEGVGTLCEDEADDIDEYPDKMRVYKNGYTTGRPILKTDTTYGRRQFRFFTFCFKAFAAERLPDSVKAKGFNQRIIELPCVYGFPEFDISEVVNPAGEWEHTKLLGELMEVRNSLLIYRLQHCQDALPDIKTNLKNREKQLFKPILRVFHSTNVLDELLPVISKYVSQKREANANTLYAFIYRVIRHLIRENNSYELESKEIWKTITNPDSLPGEFNLNKVLSYESVEFGTISQKQIITICKDVFGAVKLSHHGDSNKFVFEKKKLERLGKIYDLSLEIKVSEGENENGEDGEDLGIGRYLNPKSKPVESATIPAQINQNITPETAIKHPSNTDKHPQSSPTSPTSPTTLKCPFNGCNFKNNYQETVDHHFRLTHGSIVEPSRGAAVKSNSDSNLKTNPLNEPGGDLQKVE